MKKWSCWRWAVTLTAMLALGAAAEEPATPEAALDLLFAHLAQGDGKGVIMLFHPESPTRSRFETLARQSGAEHENVTGMLGGLGAVLASSLKPLVAVTGVETGDTRTTLRIKVTSEAVPGFVVETATELWKDSGENGQARWLFYDEELLTAYLNEGKGATPEVAAETLRVMTEYSERARDLRQAEQAATLAEARSTPESCARAYLRFLAQGRALELLAMRHPGSREAQRLAKLKEENEDIYRTEVISFSEACKTVFDELLLEPALQAADAGEGEGKPDTHEYTVTLTVPHREGLAAEGRLVLRQVTGGADSGWHVWESTVEEAMFKMGFEAGGSVASRLQALMDEAESRMRSLQPEAPEAATEEQAAGADTQGQEVEPVTGEETKDPAGLEQPSATGGQQDEAGEDAPSEASEDVPGEGVAE